MKSYFVLLLLLSPLIKSYGQADRSDAEAAAKVYADAEGIKYDEERNVYIKKGVIHLFMYNDGGLLRVGYPTTATDKNKFQLHLFTGSDDEEEYFFSAEGSYKMSLNIDGDVKEMTSEIVRKDFPIVGPFTDQVTFKVRRGKETTDLAMGTIDIAKTIHASIGSGFVVSTLKNPTDIRTVTREGGETVLEADNPRGNATLALFATLYPWGRNALMFPKKSLKERSGIVVGTTIASSDKNFENLYLGLQIDFATGGSVVFGADIADRQMIRGVDYKDFEFGTTAFSGSVEDYLYKDLGVGFFIGVQVDSRILSKMFSSNP